MSLLADPRLLELTIHVLPERPAEVYFSKAGPFTPEERQVLAHALFAALQEVARRLELQPVFRVKEEP